MDLPSLRQLEYAIALADHRHFGRAAEAVHVTQPGLSGQIRELERRVGVELFERSTRGAAPTAVGTEVVELARRILRQVDDLVHLTAAHTGTVRGPLRIAAIPTVAPYLLPAIVQTIHEAWPDARLDIQELQSSEMVDAVERGDLDLGVLAVPFETRALHVEPLAREPFHLALPEGHDLSGDEPLALSALTDLEMLLLPEGHCLRDHALEACEIAGRVEHSEIHGASLATLTQMVAGGVGVTLLPACAITLEARPGTGVTTRPLDEPAPGRTIALAWRTTDPRSDLYGGLTPTLAAQLRDFI